MSTGGGWQDQVGGLSTGAKYITAEAGMHQYPKVKELELSQETKDELNERFALIYTGQRRLARNLLRDVVQEFWKGLWLQRNVLQLGVKKQNKERAV